MRTLSPLLFITMATLSLTDCGIVIKDAQFCSPVPGSLGAVCDNLLTSNQQILSEDEWQSLQKEWNLSGQAVECTTSNTLGDIKSEFEKVCSRTRCSYKAIQAYKGLKKILELADKSRAILKERMNDNGL